MRVADAAQIQALEAELAAERERSRILEAQLRNLADHDPLTDLLNRRSFEQELEEHLAGCVRYGPEGALLLVALDGLPEDSGSFGQWAADEAVAAIAERVADRLRVSDVVGRWGPAELAVLLPRATAIQVAVVADALVGIVAGTGTSRVPPGSLLASIGVALVAATPVGNSPPDSKAAGRGAVTMAQAEHAVGDARRQGGGCWVTAGG